MWHTSLRIVRSTTLYCGIAAASLGEAKLHEMLNIRIINDIRSLRSRMIYPDITLLQPLDTIREKYKPRLTMLLHLGFFLKPVYPV